MTDARDDIDDARVMPHNLDAEKAVLGALLLHADLVDSVAELLQPVDFYRSAHQTIFTHALRLCDRREAVDMLTLKDALATAGQLESVGGVAYLASLTDGLPRSSNVLEYARIVREKATRREIITAAHKAIALAHDSDESAAAVLDSTQQDIFTISTDRAVGGLQPLSEIVVRDVMPQVAKLHELQQPVSGVPTGLIDLDYFTRGWQPTDLILLASRPSMGKTSFVLNAALHASMQAERHVGFFSLEMSKAQLGFRAVISEAQIDGERINTGRLYDTDWSKLSQAYADLGNARLHVDDSSFVGVHEIRARARKMKAFVGLDLIVIDYIQLMKASKKTENRTIELGEISRALKGLAKDLNVPVLALSQLSRQCEARADKRPLMSDLRESGALEQDADLVIFIYRDEVYNKDTDAKGVAELIVSKHRNGRIGTVKVGFQSWLMKFSNLHHASVGDTRHPA